MQARQSRYVSVRIQSTIGIRPFGGHGIVALFPYANSVWAQSRALGNYFHRISLIVGHTI